MNTMNDTTTTPEVEVKTCEDCTAYLLCKKVTAEDDNHPTCEKFEDNFPEDEDGYAEFEDGEDHSL